MHHCTTKLEHAKYSSVTSRLHLYPQLKKSNSSYCHMNSILERRRGGYSEHVRVIILGIGVNQSRSSESVETVFFVTPWKHRTTTKVTQLFKPFRVVKSGRLLLSVPHSSHQLNTRECGSITVSRNRKQHTGQKPHHPPVEVELACLAELLLLCLCACGFLAQRCQKCVACHRMGRSPSWTRTAVVFLCLVLGPLARASVPTSRPAFLGAYAMRERNLAAGRVTTGGARRPEIGKDVPHMYPRRRGRSQNDHSCLQVSRKVRLSFVGCKRNRQMLNSVKLKANGNRNSR